MSSIFARTSRSHEDAHHGRRRERLNLFLAAPMSGFESDEIYRLHRDRVISICEHLEANSIINSVYFAGRELHSASSFEDPAEAMTADYIALRDCDLFLLYYPAPIRSSVLVEAGIAIGFGKKSLFACKRLSDLPYLLRTSSKLSDRRDFPKIDVWEWNSESVDPAAFANRVLATLSISASI